MKKMDVLLGLQWGDEGKGKIVDVLASKYDVVTRFQGGPNAGHTLEFQQTRHVLHQIPSGIFRPHTKNLIGSGSALDPVIFKYEVESLEKILPDVKKNLYISKKAVLILPTHRMLDRAYEQRKGYHKIGSTLKGIGPSYQDKVARQGLRVGDILMPTFKDKLEHLVAQHVDILEKYKVSFNWSEQTVFWEAIDFLTHCNLVDSEYFLDHEITSGSSVLAEGAQGSLLDIDFGSYPFVTSSHTISAGACIGLGVPPTMIGQVFGVFKAYGTRVGEGPFPTELTDEDGDKLRKEGKEFGSTTGRPRRCGWLDLPALKYAIMINGVSQLFMMKVDVLNTFPCIKVCTKYRLSDDTLTDRLPYDLVDADITPLYEEIEGWNTSISCAGKDNMPSQLRAYIAFVQEQLGVPITLVSVGPDRDQTIML